MPSAYCKQLSWGCAGSLKGSKTPKDAQFLNEQGQNHVFLHLITHICFS